MITRHSMYDAAGKLLAQEAGIDGPPKGLTRFTGFVKYPYDGIEEIDVDAIDGRSAKILIKTILKKDYEPGGKFIKIESRHGLYL